MELMEKEFMEVFMKIFKAYGFKDLQLKIIVVLYLEPEEIAMEDIAKKIGYSLASVSNTMKMLESVGVVKRIRKPKTKKVFFYMEKDLIKLNIQKIMAAREIIVGPVKEFLPNLIEKHKKNTKDEKSKKKLKIMENYYYDVLKFEKILAKWVKDLEEFQ